METEVRQAFIDRPHLVDRAQGFLGMETFVESQHPTVFHLVTRWTDAASFQRWHHSEAHHDSHRFIPKGLKLDSAWTSVTVLERIDGCSERDRFQALVADASPLLATFFRDAASAFLISVSPDGRVLTNTSSLSALGRWQGNDGIPLWDHLPTQNAELLQRMLAEGTRESVDDSVCLTLASNSQGPASMVCKVDVQPTGLVIVGEPLARPEHDLGTELMRLSRELATPLRTLRQLAASTLDDEGDPEEKRASLESIRDTSDRALAIVANLLEFVCMRSSHVAVTPVEVDLAAFVREIEASGRALAAPKGLRLDVRLEGEPQATFDRARIRQAIDHLVSNAVKFSDCGTTVTVEIDAAADALSVSVSDQGQGIRTEDVPLLFRPFQRTGTQPTGDESGSGLGLCICRQIVERHGGRLQVDTEFGKGSRFFFTLPSAADPRGLEDLG